MHAEEEPWNKFIEKIVAGKKAERASGQPGKERME
jgi:hypothetical protein